MLIYAKIPKGKIRNTIFKQIKNLLKIVKLLSEAKYIKKEEFEYYLNKNPKKSKKLKIQIDIISNGIRYILKAINKLESYKNTTSK